MLEIKKGSQRFYIGESEDNRIAEITYTFNEDNHFVVEHTYVSEELRGQGIAKLLVEKIVSWARKENKKIIPICPYVKDRLENDPAYHDVV